MQIVTSIFGPEGIPKVAPEGMLSRVLLCFLTTAGFFYINIMPALVDGLIEGLHFSNTDAGLVSSANMYGTACGSLLIVFLIKKIIWKPWAFKLLLGLIAVDLVSMQITSSETLMVIRFCHGLMGGALVGIGFAIIARTHEPDKTFGVLLFVQFGLGGLGVMLLPPLVPQFGIAALFLSLIVFAVISLMMLCFLPDYSKDDDEKEQGTDVTGRSKLTLLAATFFVIFLFQAANMGLYAFIIGLGKHYGLTSEFILPVLGVAAWTGVVGSLFVIVVSTRFGRSLPLLLGIVLTLAGTLLLHFSAVETAFIVANCGVGITWAFVMPYLFGMCAEFDKAGQMAALGGFSSKMGLASGPLVAAFVLGSDNYGLLINIASLGLFISILVIGLPALVLDRKGKG